MAEGRYLVSSGKKGHSTININTSSILIPNSLYRLPDFVVSREISFSQAFSLLLYLVRHSSTYSSTALHCNCSCNHTKAYVPKLVDVWASLQAARWFLTSVRDISTGGDAILQLQIARTLAHIGRTDHLDDLQIDHLDQIDPDLLSWDIVQDLCYTDPTQETCALDRSCRVYGYHPAT